MNKHNAPVFRKAMSGYNKEDVNSYIINMSKRFSEAEKEYRVEIASLKEELSKKEAECKEVQANAEAVAAQKDAEIAEMSAKIEELLKTVAEKDEIISAKQTELEQRRASERDISADFGGITDELEKAKLFDCVSAKTGEIILIASKTADDIIERAKKEAEAIVGEAREKKDTMLRSISGSADTVATDISTYIKNAVDGCIEKIYSSIKSVDTSDKK